MLSLLVWPKRLSGLYCNNLRQIVSYKSSLTIYSFYFGHVSNCSCTFNCMKIKTIFAFISNCLQYAFNFQLGHTEVHLPYISDTGTLPPESCIFGQFLNVGALLVGIDIFIRFKQASFF